jgi:hypothetical protein
MRNTTLSRLALFGLAAISSFAFAANSVSGEIRLDASFVTNQDDSSDVEVSDATKADDKLFISRARLDFAGDVAKDWNYFVRVGYNEHENNQFGRDEAGDAAVSDRMTDLTAVISQAYVTWTGLEGITLKLGRIGCPEVTSDRLYYRPYIGAWPTGRSVGAMVGSLGNHPGMSIEGKAGPVGYTAGVWRQTAKGEIDTLTASSVDSSVTTDATFADYNTYAKFTANKTGTGEDAKIETSIDSQSLRLGYAARLTFSPESSSSTAYGLGIGYSSTPLNKPIMIGVVSVLGDDAASDVSSIMSASAYNTYSNFCVDASAVFGALQLNAGYAAQNIDMDESANYNTGNDASKVFQNDGEGSAYWLEAGYLLMGDSYKFDAAKAVVSGVKLRDNQAGLELTARYGHEEKSNVLALLDADAHANFKAYMLDVDPATDLDNVSAWDNATNVAFLAVGNIATADAGTAQTDLTLEQHEDETFVYKKTGFALNANFYVNDNATIKAEFEQVSNEYKVYSDDSSLSGVWKDSADMASVSTLRIRAQFKF